MSTSLNVAVIADHHGAFVTAASVKHDGRKIFLVCPEKQAKYKATPFARGDADFASSLQTAFPDWEIAHASPLEPVEALCSHGVRGPTLVLGAGAIVNRTPDPAAFTGIALTKACRHAYIDHRQLSMYHMLGIKAKKEDWNTRNFFVNRSLSKRKQAPVPRDIFGFEDLLVGTALSASDTLRHGAALRRACVVDVWAATIALQSPAETFLAYPFDLVNDTAEKVAGCLPQRTSELIAAKAKETTRWLGVLQWAAKHGDLQ